MRRIPLWRDAAYGIYFGLAVGLPLAAWAILATMGEAGMMAGILLMLLAVLGTGVGLALSLACWREWPLLILAVLAVASAKAWAEGVEGWYVLPVVSFALTASGFGAWWVWRRRRVFVEPGPRPRHGPSVS